MEIKIIQREIYLLDVEEEMLHMSDGFIGLFNKYLWLLWAKLCLSTWDTVMKKP